MKSTLLVEGIDDQEVVRQLLRHHGYELHVNLGELFVKQGRGYEQMLASLDVYWKSTDATNLGIVVDRDFDLASKPNPWPSLRHRILEVIPEVALPEQSEGLPREGVVVSAESGRRLGIWIMPDNQSLGTLETFVGELIPPSDTLWIRARNTVAAIPDEDRRFKHRHDKACIHTWLAWQEEPGVRMGTALHKNYFNPESASAIAFVNWLEKLTS